MNYKINKRVFYVLLRAMGLEKNSVLVYQKTLNANIALLREHIGDSATNLLLRNDPSQQEDLLPCELFQECLENIQLDNPGMMYRKGLRSVGHLIYPTIKECFESTELKSSDIIQKHQGIIKTHFHDVKSLILFEGAGYELHHSNNVPKRNYLKVEDHHIVVDARSPGYDCRFITGVFEGICQMFGYRLNNRIVTQTSCIQKGNETCIYDIKWID